MRCHTVRLVRLATVAFPCLWFIYVVHIVFLSEADSSLRPRDLFLDAQKNARQSDQHLGAVDADSVKTLPKDKEALNAGDALSGGESKEGHAHDVQNAHDAHNALPQDTSHPKKAHGVKRVIRAIKDVKKDQMMVGQADDDSDHRRRGQAVVGGSDVDNDDDSLRVGPERDAMKGRDVDSDGLKKSGDDDSYSDVTYPPYVETLPKGAKGQGMVGLHVDQSRLSEEQRQIYKEKWDKNQFNQYSSDLIPVHRELPDFRPAECQQKQYPSVLPNISVVIIFHNEAWSVLLRSVHSILDRTEPHLLVEIILVDDFSSMEHLKRPLEKYFRDNPKVKIVRAPERGGLIKARLRGFAITTGEVVVFLDSHIECTDGWAKPLLWMISEDYRTVPFPVIDMISAEDLRYIAHDVSPYGIFSMNTLTFRWSSQLQRPARTRTEPKPSPTMPGGLFAISRKWFQELGTYDPELDYWGGENMELSFKVWMCGGSVVIAECSHIGHIFRSHNPIKWNQKLGNRNYVRVAMVWLDEYKNHYLERTNYKLGDYGDITDRLAIRDRLKCHNFAWYVDNVYPELKQQIVFNATYTGEIRHEQSGLCLDKMGDHMDGPQLFSCHQQGGNQFWFFRDDTYLQADSWYACSKGSTTLKLCSEKQKEKWSYNLTTRQLIHVKTGQCLQKSVEQKNSHFVKLAPCTENSDLQKWTLEHRQKFKYR